MPGTRRRTPSYWSASCPSTAGSGPTMRMLTLFRRRRRGRWAGWWSGRRPGAVVQLAHLVLDLPHRARAVLLLHQLHGDVRRTPGPAEAPPPPTEVNRVLTSGKRDLSERTASTCWATRSVASRVTPGGHAQADRELVLVLLGGILAADDVVCAPWHSTPTRAANAEEDDQQAGPQHAGEDAAVGAGEGAVAGLPDHGEDRASRGAHGRPRSHQPKGASSRPRPMAARPARGSCVAAGARGARPPGRRPRRPAPVKMAGDAGDSGGDPGRGR